MKKKLLTLVLSTILVTSISACGAATADSTVSETTEAESTEAESAVNSAESENTQEISQGTVENTAFPMTIKHALGEVVIEKKPENIVAIAWGNPDVPLALGIVPAGISEANFGPRDENGLLAWTAKAFEDLGVTEPNVFSDTDGWDYEAIADCNPDVILAAYSGLSQEDYDRLSEIAPVVAYPTVAWATTWQEETVNDAAALGLEAEGKELVAETEKLISEKLSAYPDLEGKKVGFFWLSEDDLGSFYIYTNNDPRSAFLGDLGLLTPDSVTSLIDDEDAFYVTVSAENADVLTDVDIIITYGQESLIEAMQKDGRFSKVPAVNNGAFVLLDSNETLAAASTPTILSIPYCIDDYLKALNDAAEKIQ
ncbi:MAG: ABC transporter substrate-binding protein [Butyrivibrio sp.]|nr:ABC transporter substrate-binding protein [Butyrivibrio sp.]